MIDRVTGDLVQIELGQLGPLVQDLETALDAVHRTAEPGQTRRLLIQPQPDLVEHRLDVRSGNDRS
ncbi:hypothetical protein ACFPIJ_42730 [Dactylosporangium cerinum]|uniref:Uncharacterized protein n=1 Tax=Dactylosporangium cerinum TaxID=1434730 RepID=A0ABV9W7Q4_9ACTN